MNDEVQLGSSEGDDYEVVPIGPIRKLERRIDKIHEEAVQNSSGGGNYDELVRDVLDIMKSNQRIVNDMTESTHELKNSVEDLTHKMDEVVDNMNTFMDLLTEASEMDMEGQIVGDIEHQIAEAIGTKMDNVAKGMMKSNKEVVDQLEEVNQSLRRSYASGSSQQMRPNKSNMGNMGNNVQRPEMSQSGDVSGDSNNSMELGSGRDNRMKRLREKFGDVKDQ